MLQNTTQSCPGELATINTFLVATFQKRIFFGRIFNNLSENYMTVNFKK